MSARRAALHPYVRSPVRHGTGPSSSRIVTVLPNGHTVPGAGDWDATHASGAVEPVKRGTRPAWVTRFAATLLESSRTNGTVAVVVHPELAPGPPNRMLDPLILNVR